mgnify:CR=1 FL=1
MGFINPGVTYIYNRKRINEKLPIKNRIFTNYNKLYNKYYQNSNFTQQLAELNSSYEFIKERVIKKQNSEWVLDSLIETLKKYILISTEIYMTTGLDDITPLSREDAINMLKDLTKLNAIKLNEKSSKYFKNGIIPNFEAQFNRKFEIVKGGCITLNNFFDKRTFNELPNENFYKQDMYEYEDEDDYIQNIEYKPKMEPKMESNIEPNMEPSMETLQQSLYKEPEFEIPKPKSLTDLPDDILVKIISYSHNIESISLTSSFFHKFILSHIEFISYQMMIEKFVHTYSLINKNQIDEHANNTIITEINDEIHHSNSHNMKVSDNREENNNMENIKEIIRNDFKRDINGKFHTQRYRDPDNLVIISLTAFETPFMTYAIYKSLGIDRVLTSSLWPDFEETYSKELEKLNENNQPKIDKSVFKELWTELPIALPFLNPRNVIDLDYIRTGMYVDKLRIILDLLVLETKFTNELEDIFHFIVSLCVKISEDLIENNGNSIIPVEILKNYGIFYMRQEKLENDETPEEDDFDDDETLWNEISFNNPAFYSILKNKSDIQLENLLCPLFLKDHICNDLNFWEQLHYMEDDELIDEIITKYKISPSSHVLNSLVF